jgi:glycine dehydrogenase
MLISITYYFVVFMQVMENPGWYTAYTPYQAEISQGRLQSLLNFQTMVTDLTALPLANASLLDESTAAAEAMGMCFNLQNQKKFKFFVDQRCHPQNIALVQTRGEALGMQVQVGDVTKDLDLSCEGFCGVMVQYPDTYGTWLVMRCADAACCRRLLFFSPFFFF